MINIRELNAIYESPYGEVFTSPNYQPPTPEILANLISVVGWNHKQVAMLVGVNESTLRKWTANKDSSAYRQIPYSAWRLLLAYSGKTINKVEAFKIVGSF